MNKIFCFFRELIDVIIKKPEIKNINMTLLDLASKEANGFGNSIP